MSTTVVTALYDIERGSMNVSNRSISQYEIWLQTLLKLNVPMVIYVPKILKDFVYKNRNKEYQTKIVVREFEDLHAYKYQVKIQQSIDAMRKKYVNNLGMYKKHIEFTTYKYETVIFSKFDFLKEIASENPFDSKYFVWLDAGTFRDNQPFNFAIPWPDKNKMCILDNKFLVVNYSLDMSHKITDKIDFLTNNDNHINAHIMGGDKEAILRTHKLFWKEVDIALSNNVINNEQNILTIMVLENPDYYYIYDNPAYKYQMVSSPTRDRMIVYELRNESTMISPAPINNKIKLVGMATRNVNAERYEKWETTAKYFGYDYEILGRNEDWKGWNGRIKSYLQFTQESSCDIICFTDMTDVFIVGRSSELHEKFIKMHTRLIVGGEMNIFYNTSSGKYGTSTIENHFNNISESAQKFPNGGFVMGYKKELIELFKTISDYNDDQAGYMDIIYNKSIKMDIDYKTVLIGNVPNYGIYRRISSAYFKYIPVHNRYQNIYNKECPVIFHFPGNNRIDMDKYYDNMFKNNITQKDDSLDALVSWVVIFIFIIILCYGLFFKLF